jgi:hypothetical protein
MSTSTKQKSEPRAPRRLLTYPEYAAENRISVDTVRRMVGRGELTIKRVSPNRVFIVDTATI